MYLIIHIWNATFFKLYFDLEYSTVLDHCIEIKFGVESFFWNQINILRERFDLSIYTIKILKIHMIRVAIVDDEPKSISSLAWELSQIENTVEIVGRYGDVKEALLQLEGVQPDCVFLDIAMPGVDGFKFLEQFPNRNFEVIFVTAYAQHAIHAIRERAFDYLLKPVDSEDLKNVLDRIKPFISEKKSKIISDINGNSAKRITINTDSQLIKLNPEEVIYCESEGSYSNIHTLKDGKILVSKRLKLLEEIFSDFRFYRIHHSFLINLDQVKSYNKSSNKVHLEGGISLPVSRLKKPGFKESLK